jgi:hypothetical protein
MPVMLVKCINGCTTGVASDTCSGLFKLVCLSPKPGYRLYSATSDLHAKLKDEVPAAEPCSSLDIAPNHPWTGRSGLVNGFLLFQERALDKLRLILRRVISEYEVSKTSRPVMRIILVS